MVELLYKPFDFGLFKLYWLILENHLYRNILKISMRKLIMIPLLLILVASLVHAQQNVTAGISPDNPMLWKIELFFEHASAAITSNDAEKINKRMHSAEERAAEMEKMLRWKKTEAAQSAKLAFDDEISTLQQYFSEFEYKSPQNELEAEYTVQEILQTYDAEITAVTATLESAELDDAQKQIVQQFLETVKITDFQAALNAKKDATFLKLKANGLTDDDIAALETGIFNKIKNVANTLFNNTVANNSNSSQLGLLQENPNELVEVQSSDVQQSEIQTEVIDQPIISESSPIENTNSVVIDVSSKSKLKIDGTLTAEQEQAVNLLYSQFIVENTEAEVGITVTQMDNGLWKIEKEIDGTLTVTQDQQLDALLILLGNSPSSSHITVKYDPTTSDTNAYVGESSGVSTSFVIG